MPITKRIITIALLSFLISLTGCLSLAEDITPPPGMEAPPPSRNTPELKPTEIPAEPIQVEVTSEPVYPQTLPDPNNGSLIYAEKCAPCHGETGFGDGPDSALLDNPVPALGSTALAYNSTPADWYTMVTLGNMSKFMPPFSSLTDQERWDVVAYLYTLSAPPEIIDLGETLFVENCASCHGENGKQDIIDIRDEAFMSQRSAAEIADTIANGQGEMPGFESFSEIDRLSVAAYLRSLTFLSFEGILATDNTVEEITDQESDIATESEPLASEAIPFDGIGAITVYMVNASDGDIPELEIILRGYDEMVEVYTQTLTLSEGEELTFEDVPMPTGRMLFATAQYGNAVYGSDVLTVGTNPTDNMELKITYYPPTTDPSILRVERLHVFFSFVAENTLEVLQLYIFSNPTNQVLAPAESDGTAVNFTLPPNATNLFVEDNLSMAYKRTEDGFGIVNVYPDENPYQTVFSYQVPYEDRKLDLSIPIGLDTTAVIVMAPASGIKIKSDQLEDAGTRDFEGISYNMFTGSNLRSGSALDMILSGRPKTGTSIIATDGDSKNNLVIGLAGLGAALIITGIFLWRRNQANEDDVPGDDWEDEFNGETPEDLMDAIIALDDQYRTGGLPEGAYRQRRAALKERLQELLG